MIERILLIDNDLDEMDLFREAIKDVNASLECSVSEDGNEALEKLSNQEFRNIQLILLDINMPLMDGWETLALLKKDETHRHIPVIMYSTSSVKTEAEKALSLGAAGFITKPVFSNHYANLIRTIVSASKDSISNIPKEYKALNARP